jgi:hypothetical protein
MSQLYLSHLLSLVYLKTQLFQLTSVPLHWLARIPRLLTIPFSNKNVVVHFCSGAPPLEIF